MEEAAGTGPIEAGRMLRRWLSANKTRFPTHAEFAAAIGCSNGWLSKLLDGRRPDDGMAIKIHEATGGEVPGSAFRPDLWRLPEHVPVSNGEGARC